MLECGLNYRGEIIDEMTNGDIYDFVFESIPRKVSTEPEPDLAVVRGGARDYLASHPGPADVALIIEVADTSVARDRAKQRLYARAGVPHYWIVNLVDNQLEVFGRPLPGNDDSRFQSAEILADSDTVPLVIGGQTIDRIRIDDVLP